MKRVALFFLLYGFSFVAYAQLNLEITVGSKSDVSPIAITPFSHAVGLTVSEDIAQIIANNLHRSGRFEPLPRPQMPQQPSSIEQVEFKRWQTIGMPYLVMGKVERAPDGSFLVTFMLFDTFRQIQLVGMQYKGGETRLRHIAHRISDLIYTALTNEQGVFATQIAYITFRRLSQKNAEYVLNVADADGANPKKLLTTNDPIFSPAWSPDAKQIAYASLENHQSAIYVQNVRTGQRRKVAAYKGLNTAPAWSPDGAVLAMSLSQDGNSEIYTLNLFNNTLKRLTEHSAIDTEPEWSKDGRFIVFTSDRQGSPQIYRINRNGGNVRRLTFEGNYNARPRLSPDGNALALLHRDAQGYHIARLDLLSNELTVLTQSQMDESPSFAPNGSMILYATGQALAAVSIDGKVQQRLQTLPGQSVREPAWSPLIPE